MGFWSSLWNGVKEVASGIGKAISSVLSTSPLMKNLLPILAVVIPPPLDAIACVAVMGIASAFGVKSNPDELGCQMNEADMKPEDFETFADYKAYLDREYPFDAAKYEALSPDQKLACRYTGIIGLMEELHQSKGFKISPMTLGILAAGAAQCKWTEPQIKGFAEGMARTMEVSGGRDMSSVEGLAKGGLAADDWTTVRNAVEKGRETAGVEETIDEICESFKRPEDVERKIDEARAAFDTRDHI